MGQRYQLNVEGADREPGPKLHDLDRHLAAQPGLLQLGFEDRGREGRGVHGTPQPRPEIGHRPEMVLMPVGEDDAGQPVAPFFDKGGIGHEHVDARHRIVAERNAKVDDHPFAAIAVDIEVHSDLARTSERNEEKLVRVGEEGVRARCGHCAGGFQAVLSK